MQFSRSPLTEAVIELRVILSDKVSLETLAEVQAKGKGKKRYPDRRNRWLTQGQVSGNPRVPSSVHRAQVGYDFASADGRQIIQARLDGFAFIRLAPYKSWESFRDEARRWWNAYRSVTKPKTITRIAVRYINRFELPLPIHDLKDYLRTVPEIAPGLPQGLSNYFMQLHIPQEDLGAMLLLNEAGVPSPNQDFVSILLDIDIFREVDPPNSEDEIWEYFEQLRNRKNEVFLESITEHTKELIT